MLVSAIEKNAEHKSSINSAISCADQEKSFTRGEARNRGVSISEIARKSGELSSELSSGLSRSQSIFTFESANQAMHIAKHPKITDEVAFKPEDRRAVPPHMPPARRNTKQLAAVNPVKAQLAKDLRPFLAEREDV
jgi:hypothetical protein